MLPLNPETITFLLIVGTALSSALAFRFGWLWRAPLLLLTFSFPAGWFWFQSPVGEYAGLAILVMAGIFAVALIAGAGWGIILRLARVGPQISVVTSTLAASAMAGFILWEQYVPDACLNASVKVRIAGKTLHLPPELRPRLEHQSNISSFGRIDRKSSYASLCRMGVNGARAIEMDVVWITPASSHKVMTSVCSRGRPPVWCDDYVAEPYRHMVKFSIVPEDGSPPIPMSYWKEGGSIEKDRQGDLTRGSVCLLPKAGQATQCWVWHPFGQGARLSVSTNNQDPVFIDMPAAEVRDMIRRARDTTLAIIEP